MASFDTSLGSGTSRFCSTPWEAIGSVRNGDRPTLDALLRVYWRPIYRYIRAQWGRSPEDAKDLTQSFLAFLLESDLLRKADATRGRFRSFLRASIDNFARNDYRAWCAVKRGGRVPIGPLELEEMDVEGPSTPEEAYDREWRRALLEQAVRLLRERSGTAGREAEYALFASYDLAPIRPTYAELASRHTLSIKEVERRLAMARSRLREIVLELVRQTVPPEDLEDEMAQLFSRS